MDDDVRMLTVKCAEAMGWPKDTHCAPEALILNGHDRLYDPASDHAQAFELLCWLKCRGKITLTEHHFWFSIPAEMDLEYDAQGSAELRLALMRATVKVHEGRGK